MYIAVETENQLFMKNLLSTKHFVATLVVAFFTIINAFGQKPNTFFIDSDDKKHYIYGDKLTMDLFYFEYSNEEGKRKKQDKNKTKLLFTGSSVYIGIPSSKEGEYGLQQLIAFSNKYILTQFLYGDDVRLIVFKRDDLSIQKQVNNKKESNSLEILGVGTRTKGGKAKYKAILTENITKYFPECPELLEKQIKNIEDGYKVNSGISYYNCGSAPDFFTNEKVEEEKTEAAATELKKDDSYIINTKGEKLPVGSIFNDPKDCINYYEKIGLTAYSGLKYIHASKVKYFLFGNQLFLPFKNAKDQLYLMEILAYSNKNILAYDYSKKTYNVYDRNNTLLVSGVKKENLLPLVQEYFADCKDVVTHVEEAAKFLREPKNGLTNFNCNNAPKLIAE